MISINEIELAFCNGCTADCFICSKTHGNMNNPVMSWEVFSAAVEQMKEIDVKIIQTGGDGDSFLNHIYIDALRVLRREFPNAQIVLYSNFAILDKEKADILTGERLINNLFTRVDTLDPKLYKLCTGVDCETVFENIEYFLSVNKSIKFQINYSSIHKYKDTCMQILNRPPLYWKPELDGAPADEYNAIEDHFCGMPQAQGLLKFSRIRQTLWAERSDPTIKPEPDLPCERTYCFDSVCYVWPDGDVGICGYDDGQDQMIVGNVLEESISMIWLSERRRQMIEKVKARGIKGYPCINPKLCLFY